MEDIRLASLLCARLCHDLVSPVGAVVNGIEVLEDEDDGPMRDAAMDLIAHSAAEAAATLIRTASAV